MRKTWIAAAGAALVVLGAPSARAQQIALSPFVTGVGGVVHVQHDGLGRIYLVQQQGIIRVHDGSILRPTPFLNIDPIVMGGGEEGLLSVAFHPNYAANGFFYVYYTNNSGNNVVARYQRSAADPFVANAASAFILLTLSHPTFGNHNGGSINFGPDGHLYIDTGDGGGGGDPNENAQNLGSLLGKQLRLDVNSGSPYGIPAGNPFVGVPGARPEIWSYGLRNPWRFSFDRVTGDMFIGDVGQNAIEEIDFQPAGVGGRNYGWDDMEGSQCFEPSSGCLTANRVLPIIERNHSQGDCAIVGGFRYRGTQVPFLAGKYLHSDNCHGDIRVATETSPGVWSDSLGLATPNNITTFGEDGSGELYVAATNNSTVYRIVGVPVPVLSVAPVAVPEGAGVATFTVSLSPSVAQQVTVQFATTPGTATAGADYAFVSGTLTFPPASGSRTVSVPIVNDALDEFDETFTLALSSPVGATIGVGQAQGTITDDDPLPSLDVSECAVTEGDAGSTPCAFVATLSPVSGRNVMVDYVTASGTATSGSDFTAAAGTLTIAAGGTSASVNVNITGDTTVESDETFSLNLSGVVNATLAGGSRPGAIVDDDAPPLSTLELSHGGRVIADLAAAVPDLYRVFQTPRSSWEVVLDEVSGDAVPGLLLERLASDNSTVLQSGVVTGAGSALSLRWQNTLGAGVPGHHLRVRQPACGPGCGPDDTYRLRLYETTLAGPRFNNSGGQSSVVFLQNVTRQSVNARVYFWSGSGALLHTATAVVPPQGVQVILIAPIPALSGQSGSLTVSHDAPYGGLVGKAASVDPAGFSFDTPLRTRPVTRALAWLALPTLLLASEAGAQPACTHWIATTGTDTTSTPGTSAQPWRTIDFASARLLALGQHGAVACLKDGVYTGGNSLYERFNVATTFRAENAYRAVLQNNNRALSLFGARNLVFEGFEFRHTGPGADALVIQVQMADLATWSEDVVFRNNVMHDSWNNDILKINNGARRITVEGNVFYNQTGSDEHMDVNSVTDVVIQDNIFFNDFAGSGRPNNNDTSSFIVMKDSNQDDDGQIGADRITVRRNVFLNWEGSTGSNFVLIGEDGQAYFEGEDILVENNLMIGNAGNDMRAAFGVKGGRNVTFRSNTVAGNLPALAYAFRVNREGANPVNENVRFHNNIWSDPTGTMGAEAAGGTNDFSDGGPSEVTGLVLDRNLYWNGGAAIPPGDQVNPNVNDTRRIVDNPQLAAQSGIVLPRWNGTTFLGNATIRQEFVRLVNLYGAIPPATPAHNQADPALSATDDILGIPRVVPDIGAFEVSVPPALSIADTSMTEGDVGTTTASFVVSLSAATGPTVTVTYAATGVTATAGQDFTAVSGALTFPSGTLTRTVTVPVLGDALDENNETFLVTLSAPVGATLGDGQATGTILDDDPLPALSVDDCSRVEGDTGSAPCSFLVRLSPASGRTVNASFDTQNGTATAGSDYTAAAGSLTFAAGATSQAVTVGILGDTAVEPDETFVVRLLTPTNATLADAQADGVVLDDDATTLSTIELTHGSRLAADLAGGAPDLYRLAQAPYASYEVVLDAVSGDAVPGLLLQRLAADNTTVLQSAAAVGTGPAVTLRWQNPLASPVVSQHLRVGSAACGTACGPDDVYRLRAYETTATLPRFNNSASQITVLLVQNSSASTVSGRLYFWTGSGALLAQQPFMLGPRASLTLITSTLPALAGQGGSITVSHDGGHGAVAGKAVSLEPATGFSFDTPLTYRPR